MKKLVLISTLLCGVGIWQANATDNLHLDSTISRISSDSTKTVYEYDNNGNKILEKYCYWSKGGLGIIGPNKDPYMYPAGWGTYRIRARYEYTYDALGRKTSFTDSSSSYNKYEFSYNSEGVITSETLYSEWAQGKWMSNSKTDYTYNSNGKILLESIKGYSYAGSGPFEAKADYVYDSVGNLTLLTRSRLNSGNWINVSKNEYLYDSASNKIQQFDCTWNSYTSKWINNNKDIFTFDKNGNNIMTTRYWWKNSAWAKLDKTEYSYDTNKNNTVKISYSWDTKTASWIGSQKSEYSFNTNNKLTGKIFYMWDSPTASWIVSEKIEDVFDNNGNITLHKDIRWASYSSTWLEPDITTYYYSSGSNKPNTTPVAEIVNDAVKVFPNPAKGSFSTNNEGTAIVKMYSSNGALVQEIKVLGKERISVADLSAGLYVVQITTENGVVTSQRLLVE